VTKWVEAKALYYANEQFVVDFPFEEKITCFDVPGEIFTDQGAKFTSNLVQSLTLKYRIKHKEILSLSPSSKWASGINEQGDRGYSYQDYLAASKRLG
jgi:hypothetical protein